MAIHIADFPETITPTAEDTELAQALSYQLSILINQCPTESHSSSLKLCVQIDDKTEELMIPLFALRLLKDVLTQIAHGHTVILMPIHTELTTQQAAEILNVSRPFLINLLDDGKIPYRKVGTHRRIRFDDLIAYKQEIDQQRLQTLTDLTREAQALNMGY